MDIPVVSPENLQTREEYATCLLFCIASMKTLEAYQMEAYKKGLLDEVEEETSKTVCWEIQRLIALCRTQITKVIEKTGFDEQEALLKFKKSFPNVKIPRKRNGQKNS